MEEGVGDYNKTTKTDFNDSDYSFLKMWLIGLMYWPALIYVPLGVVGNVTSFLITTKKSNRNVSTCVYMSALSVVDTNVLLSILCYRSLFVHGLGETIQDRFNSIVFFWYWSYTAGMASGLFLAGMSLDRAIAILFPLRAKAFCTASKAKKAIGIGFILPAVLNVNMFFTFDLNKDIITGLESVYLNYPEPRWVEQVVGAYMLSFGTIIPFSIIMTCNVIIIGNVRKAARTRNKMAADGGGAASEERHLTRMLILVAVAYVILSIPMRLYDMVFSIPALVEKYDMSDPYWRLRFNVELWTVTEMWDANFAVNFYLYFMGGGKKYRNEAKQVFTMFCWKQDKER